MQNIRAVPHGPSAISFYNSESRQIIKSLLGFRRITNTKIHRYGKINIKAEDAFNRTYVTLANDGTSKHSYNFNESENSKLLKVPLGVNHIGFFRIDRYLSNKCKMKSENKEDEPIKNEESSQLTKKDRLKKAVKDYGSVVIIYHLTLSWGSLAFLYFLISNGIDVMNLLNGFPFIAEKLQNNSLAAGASTFFVAYAIYKAIAPVRYSITIASCPFLVRFLQRKGIIKP